MKALVIDDEPLVCNIVAGVLTTEGWNVHKASNGEDAIAMLERENWSLVFCDVQLGDADGFAVLRRFTELHPESNIILMTGYGSAEGALEAVSLGAYDYLLKPFDLHDIQTIARNVRNKLLRNTQASEFPVQTQPTQQKKISLIGQNPAFVEVMKLVGRVAGTNLPVLITGESGTGKEVVARAIHLNSARANESFVTVNCGAIPADLIESELFGHVKGSFTGATSDRRGLLEEANGGTVFLDEITETTLPFQVKLLRALQAGEIRRVGSNKTTNVDVRVIAATNRHIEREVHENRFRQDLLYRLNVVTINLPPLRERRDDVVPLTLHFARRVVREGQPQVSFSAEVLQLLKRYTWPGNIRELENAVMHAVALCDHIVMPTNLPERIRFFGNKQETTDVSAKQKALNDNVELITLDELINRHLLSVLTHTKGNKQAASRILGIDRTTIQRLIKRHNLDVSNLK